MQRIREELAVAYVKILARYSPKQNERISVTADQAEIRTAYPDLPSHYISCFVPHAHISTVFFLPVPFKECWNVNEILAHIFACYSVWLSLTTVNSFLSLPCPLPPNVPHISIPSLPSIYSLYLVTDISVHLALSSESPDFHSISQYLIIRSNMFTTFYFCPQ